MNYIENKLKEFDEQFPENEMGGISYTFRDGGYVDRFNLKDFIAKSLTDYHNHILQKLLKHFNDLESKDTDDSMNNWRNYKFIRNNIVDCLQDTNPKE